MNEQRKSPPRPAEVTWHMLGAGAVRERLGVHEGGLDEASARRRLKRHGPNRVGQQDTVSAWAILLHQFQSPLIYVLLVALAVTLGLQSWKDAIVIGVVLVVNGTIGFIQEYQAQSAVKSLMKMVSPKARVRRDGQWREIPADRIVPGDEVRLGQGYMVPADARLLSVQALQIDESALTGESVPQSKTAETLADADPALSPGDRKNMAFMGTAVTSGGGTGLVVATGRRTEVGRIAEQVERAKETTTPLQERIGRLARGIALAILGVAAASMGIGLAMGRGLDEMVLLAVALAVAAIPAGLPIVVTVALAIGVRRMARRHAVIRHLPAVDTLGSCTAIVSDKTGTLTQNLMTVRAIWADGDFEVNGEGVHQDKTPVRPEEKPSLRDTLLVGALCNDAPLAGEGESGAPPSGDPMEIALVRSAEASGLDPGDLRESHPRIDEVPFRTEQRFMATVHRNGEPLVCVKGAPERILRMCDRRSTAEGEAPLDEEAVREREEALAGRGLRVLAFALGHGQDAAKAIHDEDPRNLTFVGLQGMLDPPRRSAIEAIDRCHEAGIRVVMVTGDHARTASAIAQQVHIRDGSVRAGQEESPVARPSQESRSGRELMDLDDDALDEVLSRVDVYARVEPGQKLRIVERLKAHDEVVAVTGDGVNDAPALESAHLGAAMGSGTDVAKEASDMVITDDDFASVYAAVEEGRTAFRNIRMATFFLLSTGAADVLIILTALVLRWPLPLLPAQILWCNVVTNGIADVALAFEPGEEGLYRRPPRPKGEGVLDRILMERLVLVGIWLAAGTLAVFSLTRATASGPPEEVLALARTAALTTLVLFQKVHVFNCRSEDTSLFRLSLLRNRVLFLGVLTSLAIHVAAIYWPPTQSLLRLRPLDARTWLIAFGVALTAIVVNEIHKWLRPSHRGRPSSSKGGSS